MIPKMSCQCECCVNCVCPTQSSPSPVPIEFVHAAGTVVLSPGVITTTVPLLNGPITGTPRLISGLNTSTGQFTVPNSGVWNLTLMVTFEPFPPGPPPPITGIGWGGERYLRIVRQTGTRERAFIAQYHASLFSLNNNLNPIQSNVNTTGTATAVIELRQGEILSIELYQMGNISQPPITMLAYAEIIYALTPGTVNLPTSVSAPIAYPISNFTIPGVPDNCNAGPFCPPN